MPTTLPRRTIIVVMVLLCLVTDYLLGPYFAFPAVFIIPIALTAWWHGRWAGIAVATVLALARVGCGATWELPVPNLMKYVIINAIIREMVFVVFVLLVDRVQVQKRALEQEVKVLEGLLPICSYCKKIRNETSEWEQLETYITKRSAAEFSHTICPDCRHAYFDKWLPAKKDG